MIHRKAEDNWTLKSATISQERDGTYYCSVLYEFDYEIPVLSGGESKAIGLDYKSDGFYQDSNGDICGSPKYYRKTSDKLAKSQRKLKKRPSEAAIIINNRKKLQQYIGELRIKERIFYTKRVLR